MKSSLMRFNFFFVLASTKCMTRWKTSSSKWNWVGFVIYRAMFTKRFQPNGTIKHIWPASNPSTTMTVTMKSKHCLHNYPQLINESIFFLRLNIYLAFWSKLINDSKRFWKIIFHIQNCVHFFLVFFWLAVSWDFVISSSVCLIMCRVCSMAEQLSFSNLKSVVRHF